MGVHDLKLEFNICDPFGFKQLGVTDERGQNVVCASHGVCALEELWTHHRAASRRRRRAYLGMRGSVSRFGFCATDVARVAARHRGVPDRQ